MSKYKRRSKRNEKAISYLMLFMLTVPLFFRVVRSVMPRPTTYRPAPIVQAQPPTATANAVDATQTHLAASGPSATVEHFLRALQQDASGQRGLPDLSEALQADIAAGHSVAEIVGVQNDYQSFELRVIDDGSASGMAIVEARLDFDSPTDITFYLQQETDAWRIGTVSQHQAAGLGAKPATLYATDKVMLDYIADVRRGRTDDAVKFLSDKLRQQTDADSASTGPVDIVPTVLQPLISTPARVVYHANLYVQPQTSQTALWQQGDNERWIELVKDADGWHINQIDEVQLES